MPFLILLLTTRCMGPLAWTTPPVYPLQHPQAAATELYGGARLGQPPYEDVDFLFDSPSNDVASERFYAAGYMGIAGQGRWFLYNITAWTARARYLFSDHRLYNNTAFHLQADLGASGQIGQGSRLEAGLGLGVGGEHLIERGNWGRVEEYERTTYRFPIPTASIFVGFRTALNDKTTLGFRSHLVGLGTGLTISLRYRGVQFFTATQVFPLLRSGETPSLANWTVGLMGFIPLGRKSGS